VTERTTAAIPNLPARGVRERGKAVETQLACNDPLVAEFARIPTVDGRTTATKPELPARDLRARSIGVAAQLAHNDRNSCEFRYRSPVAEFARIPTVHERTTAAIPNLPVRGVRESGKAVETQLAHDDRNSCEFRYTPPEGRTARKPHAAKSGYNPEPNAARFFANASWTASA
jgi:hypothetical protein